MKKTFLFFLLISLFSLLGCEKEKEKNPELGIQLQYGSPALNALTFIATPQNAEQCAAMCLEPGAPIPSAEDVLKNGTVLDASKQASYTAYGLNSGTEYRIVAAVRAGEKVKLSAPLTMTTLSADDPDIDVSLTLRLVEAGVNSLTFNIMTNQAQECRYICREVGEGPNITIDEVLASGEVADVTAPKDYTVTDLKMDTEYFIVAVAKAGEKVVRKDLKVFTDTNVASLTIEGAQVAKQTLSFDVVSRNMESYICVVKEDGAEIFTEEVKNGRNKSFEVTVSAASENPDIEISVAGKAKDGSEISSDYQIDPETDIVTFFFKKVNVLQFTATWCGYCPYMVESLDKYKAKHPGRIAVIAVHNGDAMELSPNSNNMMRMFNIEGYPTAIMDYRLAANLNYSSVEGAIEEQLKRFPATVDIKLETTAPNGAVDVTARIKNSDSKGHYKYVCALVENNVRYSGGTSPTGLYHDVLRAFLNSSEKGGDFLDSYAKPTEFIPIDKETVLQFKANISSWDVDNMCAVFYILKQDKKGGQWFVNNTNCVKLGETADFLGDDVDM